MKIKWPVTFFIAHRGASQHAPENTISALKIARKNGAKWVECDVQLSQDGVPIIFHDTKLDRTTNGRGLLSRASYRKIRSLDAGSWFSKKFAGESVPALVDWLFYCAKLKLKLNLEMKARTKKQAELLAKIVFTELKKYPYFTEKTLLISSSNLVCLTEIMRYQKKLRCGFIGEKKLSEKKCDSFLKKNIVSVHQPYQILNQDYIAHLHQKGFRVLTYTVNDAAIVKKLKAMKVDGIFTDNAKLYRL